jgi:hypothetical protein
MSPLPALGRRLLPTIVVDVPIRCRKWQHALGARDGQRRVPRDPRRASSRGRRYRAISGEPRLNRNRSGKGAGLSHAFAA